MVIHDIIIYYGFSTGFKVPAWVILPNMSSSLLLESKWNEYSQLNKGKHKRRKG